MNNNTPELTAEEKDAMQIILSRCKGNPEVVFNLLWPYVGKAFEAGQDYHHFSDGPGPYAPDKETYLTQVLTEFKSKADANP